MNRMDESTYVDWRYKVFYVALFFYLVLAGCATVDEGAIDYRKAETKSTDNHREYLRLRQKYARGDDEARIETVSYTHLTLPTTPYV